MRFQNLTLTERYLSRISKACERISSAVDLFSQSCFLEERIELQIVNMTHSCKKVIDRLSPSDRFGPIMSLERINQIYNNLRFYVSTNSERSPIVIGHFVSEIKNELGPFLKPPQRSKVGL